MTNIKHIGFIMDGNGRWASARGFARTEGYAAGLHALKRVLGRLDENGIDTVSVYAFSTENNERPESEIKAIETVVEEFNYSYDGNYAITYMGDRYSLDDRLARSIEEIENRTADNTGLKLNIAYNYGGRADIISAAERMLDHGEFNEDAFLSYLGASHLPPLDLIVRTGGEKRLSNFMLFEAAYAELIFLDKLWPDMNESDVDGIITEFENRTRKFGK